MNDIKGLLERKLSEELTDQGYDLIDFASVPQEGDRMMRLRTLDEMISEFGDVADDNTSSYVVQVRKRNPIKPENHPNNSHQDPAVTDVYGQNGQLNLSSLEKTGKVLIQAGDYGLARNVYKTLVNQGGAIYSPRAYLGLGICAAGEGKIEEAQSHFEESIAYEPTLDAYLNLISLMVRANRDRYAAEVCERALYLRGLTDSNRFEFHKTAGNCFARLEEIQSGEAHYRAALAIFTDADEIQSNLGSMYLRAGRVEDAKRAFQDAIAGNPDNAAAHLGLGCCYMVGGEKKNAHDSFVRSLDRQPNDSNGIFYLVKCAYEIKEYAPAEQIVSRYVQNAPINPSLLYSLAGLKFHVGKFAEAEIIAKKILSVRPEHSGARQLLNLLGIRA